MGHERAALLRGLWRRPRPAALLSVAVFAAAGLLFATSAEVARGTNLRSGSRTQLTDVIRAQERRVQQRAREVAELRRQVDALTAQVAGGSERVGSVHGRGTDLALAAHTAAVRGPALRVALDDSPYDLGDPALPEGTEPDHLVVHEQDLQAVVNALWAGGAGAVQLMDQRVVSTTAVRCVGPVLLLHGRTYAPPYVVTAVGPVNRMRAALERSEQVLSYRDFVDLVGLGYQVTELDHARIPAYEGLLELDHARPLRR
ncbi:MAG: DUF881 domain-containing protein [Actinomycetota bacterium]|nr:DUF881 domain-containing protein [Actinomycetota bacterium]